MKITVHYQAQLRAAAAQSSESVELAEGATLADLIRRLADQHDDAFRRILLDGSDQPRPSILLFVGDEQCRSAGRPLREGEAVTLLAPMAGG